MLRTERYLGVSWFLTDRSLRWDLGVQAVCRLVISVPRTGPAVLLTKPLVVRDADPWATQGGKQATAGFGATFMLSGPNSNVAV